MVKNEGNLCDWGVIIINQKEVAVNGWGEGREALSVGGVSWAFSALLGAGAERA